MKKIALAALTALFIACFFDVTEAGAQQMTEEHKAQMEKLERFAGEWEAEGAVMEGDGSRLTVDLKLEVRPIVEGWAYELTIQGDIAEVGSYSEKEFLAYDPGEKCVSMATVSNWGEVGKYSGAWDKEKDNILRLSGSRRIEGVLYTIEATFNFLDDDELDWKWTAKRDGKIAGSFIALFKK